MVYGTLSKAPITEAVIDVWAELPATATIEALRALQTQLGPDYVNVEEQRQFIGSIGMGPDGSSHATSRQSVRGYLFKSRDGLNIAQARLDGFSLNRLKPYDTWSTFRAEAQRIWGLYAAAVSPVRVPRLGLRYINRIELPPNPGDLKLYFKTVPELGPELPQSLASYMMRLVIPMDDVSFGVVTQGLEGPTSDGSIPVVLDIEVRHERAYRPEDIAIWSSFDRMRDLKNHLFFNSITKQVEDWYR